MDDMGLWIISGPGEFWTDEWLASGTYGLLIEATLEGVEEIRRRIAEQGAAVDITPAAPGHYPDDNEGGVRVHENGTYRFEH